ncbi:hypothetical protein ACEPAG_3341 [Sanghuangporus baumii]
MSSQIDFLKSMYVVVDSFVCRYTLPNSPTILITNGLKPEPNAFSLSVDKWVIVGTENSDEKLFHFRLSFCQETTKESVRVDIQPSCTDMSCTMQPFEKLLAVGNTLLTVGINKHNMDRFNDEDQECCHYAPQDFADHEIQEHTKFG